MEAWWERADAPTREGRRENKEHVWTVRKQLSTGEEEGLTRHPTCQHLHHEVWATVNCNKGNLCGLHYCLSYIARDCHGAYYTWPHSLLFIISKSITKSISELKILQTSALSTLPLHPSPGHWAQWQSLGSGDASSLPTGVYFIQEQSSSPCTPSTLQRSPYCAAHGCLLKFKV